MDVATIVGVVLTGLFLLIYLPFILKFSVLLIGASVEAWKSILRREP
jgi:hypothetical protein